MSRRYHRGRRRDRPASFGEQLVVGCVVVAAIVFIMTPEILMRWRVATTPRQELLAREQSVYYSGCNEARAAGAAPIYRGQPGYRPEMDGDNDGIACEPYH